MSIWLVSGSSRFDRVVSEAILGGGDCVVVTARDRDRFADMLERYRARIRVVPAEATDPEAAGAIVDAALARFGRLDALVTIAGGGTAGSLEDLPLEDLEAQIASGLWAPIHLTRAALPVMRAQGAGHVVQVSLADGRNAAHSRGAHLAATLGLSGYLEALAGEVDAAGIRVTILERGGAGARWVNAAEVAQALLGVVADRRPPLRRSLGVDPGALAAIGACSIRCEQYGR
jgi:NAD(P)-dependent dehydrogenase (short-subunit alcohol dehydrogenase family)